MPPDGATLLASASALEHAEVEAVRVSIACTPERRRRVYRAAAARLQQFADAHPEIRHDLEAPEIDRAIESLNEALTLFMEGRCKREQVSAAFEEYEQALISATDQKCDKGKPRPIITTNSQHND